MKAALPVLLLLAACASTVEVADDALLRGDYDRAVLGYQEAIAEGPEPAEAARLETKLAAARGRASLAHVEESRRLLAEQRFDAAFREAELAVEMNASDAAQGWLAVARREYAKSLRERAVVAVRDGRTDDAIEVLTEAERVQSDPENRLLLTSAQREAAEYHRQAFPAALETARGAMRARQWEKACYLYEKAHGHDRTPESTKEAGFCARMRDAERAASLRKDGEARAHFDAALEAGFDRPYVEQRRRALVYSEYVLTVEGATLLPFRPDTGEYWDVVPGDRPAENAQEFLSGLAARLSRAPDRMLAELARDVGEPPLGSRAPDAYPVVLTPGLRAGGREVSKADRVLPRWDFPVTIRGRVEDNTEISVTVFDLDASGRDEEVGTFTTTIGALVSLVGPREIVLFDSSGHLASGGLLVLRLSVVPK